MTAVRSQGNSKILRLDDWKNDDKLQLRGREVHLEEKVGLVSGMRNSRR